MFKNITNQKAATVRRLNKNFKESVKGDPVT